jgi:hypothetical protein
MTEEEKEWAFLADQLVKMADDNRYGYLNRISMSEFCHFMSICPYANILKGELDVHNRLKIIKLWFYWMVEVKWPGLFIKRCYGKMAREYLS